MPIQHLLVPFDFSPSADQALAYAIALAQTLQACLTLLHVKDTMSWGVAQAEAMIPPAVWQQLETSLAEGMDGGIGAGYWGMQGVSCVGGN
jgi:nucleotide-binding universal stress UspA family protein